MTFYKQAENLAAYLITVPVIEHIVMTPETKVFRKHFGEDFPVLSDLARNAPLVFARSFSTFRDRFCTRPSTREGLGCKRRRHSMR